jgi:hypothetical protein
MLLTLDLDEDFIDVERVAIAAMLSLKPACANSSELDAPKSDSFATDSDATLSQEIFYISMAVTTRLRLKR